MTQETDMNKFAKAFRTARLNSGRTFREIADAIGKSIGYLSDIDSGRKNPPERSVVLQIERFFGIADGHLARLADEVRMSVPNNLKGLVSETPQLGQFLLMSQTLLREDSTFSTKLESYIEEMRVRMAESGLKPHEIDDLFYDMFDGRHLKNSGQIGAI
jgi:transcriptional regulator with XRE-family HTH domain